MMNIFSVIASCMTLRLSHCIYPFIFTNPYRNLSFSDGPSVPYVIGLGLACLCLVMIVIGLAVFTMKKKKYLNKINSGKWFHFDNESNIYFKYKQQLKG